MAKKTDIRNRTTRPHLYVIALLRFHIVKNQHMYFSLYSLFPFFSYCFLDVIISCQSDCYWRFAGAEI